jgi:phytoene/squalene synthetase
MKSLFDKISIKASEMTTKTYSTSFSLGILMLKPQLRDPIYSIYGFVRFADEIVDSFHEYNKAELLRRFSEDTWSAIEEGISLNPILNSFQHAVNKYNIDHDSIATFLKSMEMDLGLSETDQIDYERYILGSAEVVGLMCLRVFVNGDDAEYERLKPYAMKLGSAFQKVNFFRDLRHDTQELGRDYFPESANGRLNDKRKREIEVEIDEDFRIAYQGIRMLPSSSRFGVYVAYVYYSALYKRLRAASLDTLFRKRIRIPNPLKILLLARSFVRYNLNLL